MHNTTSQLRNLLVRLVPQPQLHGSERTEQITKTHWKERTKSKQRGELSDLILTSCLSMGTEWTKRLRNR